MERKDKKNIVTGQQIGLLGGPLYTTFKVLGAIKLAEVSGGNAIFWMETNDADFNEINHIDFIDAKGELRTLKWDVDSKGYSCGYIKVDDLLIEILKEFFDSVTKTEHTMLLKDVVLSCYKKERTLSEASGELFEWIFKDLKINIFNPFDSEFRRFSKKILLEEAEFTAEGDQCNLFILRDKKRLPLFKKNGRYVLRDEAQTDPEEYEILPNVRMRSVCQDAWFSTYAYIAGPGEIKYLKDLIPFYERHAVNPAKVIPRMSIDLIEPRVKRLMSKANILMEDLDNFSVEEMKKRKLTEVSGFDAGSISENSLIRTDEFIRELGYLGLKTDNVKKELNNIVKRLIGEKRREEKEKNEAILRQTGTIYNLVRPFGKKHERVFNMFYYMNLYGGRSFVNFLYKNYDQNISVLEIKNG